MRRRKLAILAAAAPALLVSISHAADTYTWNQSAGGSFKGAGQEVGKGGAEFGHEMKEGKPVAAGKEMGKGVGRAGEKVGEGAKKAVTTESDRGEREKEKK